MSPSVMFYVVGGVLVIGVLAVLLQPLWRDSRSTVAGIALTLGLGAIALYRIVGTPAALDPKQVAMPQTLDDAIGQLQAQLAFDPARCLFVDDSVPVLNAARAHGIGHIFAITRPDSTQHARRIDGFDAVECVEALLP